MLPWSQLDPSLPQVVILIEVLMMEIWSVKILTDLVNNQIIYLFINASHTYKIGLRVGLFTGRFRAQTELDLVGLGC